MPIRRPTSSSYSSEKSSACSGKSPPSRVFVGPPADQVEHAVDAVGVAELVAQGRPEDAVRVGVADVGLVAEGAGQGGLAEAAGAAQGGGDADGLGVGFG